MTLREQIERAASLLAESGIESPKLEAEVLVAHCLVKDRSFVIAHSTDVLEIPCFDQTVARRTSGEPLAYILGWREFYSRRFKVTPAVLIPRHETEILVETVLKSETKDTILDVGAGSGCIAITLSLESPSSNVTAVDISTAALEVAEENAKSLNADVELRESDLFGSLSGRTFDVIVSNPPYVAFGDELAVEVKDHEPHTALYAEDDGMAIYKRLAREAPEYLSSNGCLMLEVGDGQASLIEALFVENGWLVAEFVLDLDGNKRVAVLKRA